MPDPMPIEEVLKRLREGTVFSPTPPEEGVVNRFATDALMDQAATALEAQQAEIGRLREALDAIAKGRWNAAAAPGAGLFVRKFARAVRRGGAEG